MIQGFKSKSLKKLYEGNRSGVRSDLVEKTERMLLILDGMTDIADINLPGYRLHALKGDLKGFWSVTLRANWRIIFRFDGEHVYDVELIDYH